MSTNSRNVAIMLCDEIEVLDFAGPFEVFNVTAEMNPPAPFKPYTVGKYMEPVRARGGLQVTPHYSFATSPPPDILIVPGGAGSRAVVKDQHSIDWIVKQAAQVEILASVCTGALVLAAAGLLEAREATTHHDAFDELSAISPTTRIIRDQRYVISETIWTSGGISAGIDMSLAMVRHLLPSEAVQRTLTEMEWMWHQD